MHGRIAILMPDAQQSYILMPNSTDSWMHSIVSQLRMRDATILSHINALFTALLMLNASMHLLMLIDAYNALIFLVN